MKNIRGDILRPIGRILTSLYNNTPPNLFSTIRNRTYFNINVRKVSIYREYEKHN